MPMPAASTSPKSIDFSPTVWPFDGTQKLLTEAPARAGWRFTTGGAGSHSATVRPERNATRNTRGCSIAPTEFVCIEIVFISSGFITRHSRGLFQEMCAGQEDSVGFRGARPPREIFDQPACRTPSMTPARDVALVTMQMPTMRASQTKGLAHTSPGQRPGFIVRNI